MKNQMKATELRIGNLVYCQYDKSPRVVDFVQLELIDHATGNLFQPVPLMEGWLLKLGFVKAKHDKVAEDKIVYNLNGFQLNKFGDRWDVYTNWNNSKNSITSNRGAVKSVHQLQNIYYALTGTELNFSLSLYEQNSSALLDEQLKECKIDMDKPQREEKREINFGEWYVSIGGDLEHLQRGYFIGKDRLQEDNWLLHLSEKGWIDWNDFIPAYLQACKNAGLRKIKMITYYP